MLELSAEVASSINYRILKICMVWHILYNNESMTIDKHLIFCWQPEIKKEAITIEFYDFQFNSNCSYAKKVWSINRMKR